MAKNLFDKLSHAIKQGKVREIREAVKEIKRAGAAREQRTFATIKIAAAYDSAEDCLEVFHTVDLGQTEECLGLIARAVVAPDGETVLAASSELLDPHKHNKCVSGCFVIHPLAGNFEGRSVTVHICALTVDAAGKVSLVTADEHAAISALRPRS